jgi:hypothetical protein
MLNDGLNFALLLLGLSSGIAKGSNGQRAMPSVFKVPAISSTAGWVTVRISSGLFLNFSISKKSVSIPVLGHFFDS